MKTITKKIVSMFLTVCIVTLAIVPFLYSAIPTAHAALAGQFKTGDIIEYGYYPQSKVTDPTLRAALGEQPVDDDGDVSFEGELYRRYISNNVTDFYLYEPIPWKVLSCGKDGLFVMSLNILDYQKFHTNNSVITWDNCSLRTWLNDTFLRQAFEKYDLVNGIRYTGLINDDNPNNGLDAGSDTEDYVFIPSYYDVTDPQYGFTASNANSLRAAQETEFASAIAKRDNNVWWLRTPAVYNTIGAHRICSVDASGNLSDHITNLLGSSGRLIPGVRPAIKLDKMTVVTTYQLNGSDTPQSDLEEEERYITAHTDFIASSEYANLMSNVSFYRDIWSDADMNLALSAGITWDALRIIGKPFSNGLKAAIAAAYPNLNIELINNPYTPFFTDMLSSTKFKENIINKAVGKFNKIFSEVYGDLSKAVKSEDEWSEAYSDTFAEQVKNELKNCLLSDAKEYQFSENVKSFLLRYFGAANANKLKPIFSKLKDLNNIVGLISQGTAAINDIIDVFKAYIIAITVMESMEDDFFLSYNYAVEDMIANGDIVTAPLLQDAINKLDCLDDPDACFSYAMEELKQNISCSVFDTITGYASKNLIRGIASLFDIDAGSIGIISFAYNLTYRIMDLITANGTRSDLQKTMFSLALLERSLYDLTQTSATALSNTKNYTSAILFDSAWNALQQTNAAAFKTLAAYAKSISLKTRIRAFFNKQYEDDNMACCVHIADEWIKNNCHDRTTTTGSKIVSAQCPVDVYVYNKNGKEVLAIEDEFITKNTEDLTVVVAGGEKGIVLPSNDYRISIIAREDGNMNYAVYEMEDGDFTREVSFRNLALEAGKEYSGSIPTALRIPNEQYALTTNEGAVNCDYDSSAACADGSHRYGNWSTVQTATCSIQGYRERNCSECGKIDQMVIDYRPNVHINKEIRNATAATCTTSGYSGDEYCLDCDSLIATGVTVPATGKHTAGEPVEQVLKTASCTQTGSKTVTITCSVCNTVLSETTEEIAMTDHIDADNDGICDVCQQTLSGEDSGIPNDVCKYCNQVHPNDFVGRFIKFFHNIAYFFAHLFGKK